MTTSATVLGLGEMGQALAHALVAAGHPVTVWNRSQGKAEKLIKSGVREAATVDEALAASQLVIFCVRDSTSVQELINERDDRLQGRVLVNLTTGTPEEARAFARWAADHGTAYLDGGIMAIPAMIGQPAASILYSGSADAFDRHEPDLAVLGTSSFLGADAGLASLQDLALLAAMYALFAGFHQALAMVRPAGVQAKDFAPAVTAWLGAMLPSLPAEADMIDSGNYATDVQDLRFTRAAMDTIIRANRDQGTGHDVLSAIRTLVDRQIDRGHGDDHFARMVESLAVPLTSRPELVEGAG